MTIFIGKKSITGQKGGLAGGGVTRYRVLGLLCALLAAPESQAANVRLQLMGLEGALQKNVRARLSTIAVDEVNADGRFRSRVDDAIRQGLRALGYYDPQIDFEFRPAVNGGRPVLIATVTPGEPVKIAEVNITLRGGAHDDKGLSATG